MIIKNIKILNEVGELINQEIEISDGKITKIADQIHGETFIDGCNNLVTPSFIDVHTHSRNPGQAYKEEIITLNNSALAGGYSTICAMPNTTPIIDNPEILCKTIEQLNNNSDIEMQQYAALSKGLGSDELCDYDQLKKCGALAFSNDGRGVQKEDIIVKMMKKIKDLDMLYVSHSETDCLLNGGVMHEGIQNKLLGLKGISSSVEATAVAKEIIIANELGCKYHVCHISSKISVDLIRLFKQYNKELFTCEVTPHHLVLSENNIKTDDPNYKMNPPLRAESDRLALIEALNDGTIEIIATDHAPHSVLDKGNSFVNSTFGIIGLETAFDIIYQDLVKPGLVSLKTVIDAMTINPAKRFNINGGEIKVGAIANLTFIDLNYHGHIDINNTHSKAKNMPFDQKEVSSCITKTMIKGEIKYAKN